MIREFYDEVKKNAKANTELNQLYKNLFQKQINKHQQIKFL